MVGTVTVLPDATWLAAEPVVERVDLDDAVVGRRRPRAAARGRRRARRARRHGDVGAGPGVPLRAVDRRAAPRRRSSPATSRHPALVDVETWISRRYRVRFDGVALAHYRDGRDSVAFHRDRELRWLDDTVIGVLTLGARRPWLMRPPTGSAHDDDDLAASSTSRPASGDLLVMGGRCQADWLHAVPKVRRRVRSRVSAQWRWTSPARSTRPQPELLRAAALQPLTCRPDRGPRRTRRLDQLEALLDGDDVFTSRFGVAVEPGWAGFPAIVAHLISVAREGAPPEWGTHLFFDEADGALIGVGGWKGPPIDGAARSATPWHRPARGGASPGPPSSGSSTRAGRPACARCTPTPSPRSRLSTRRPAPVRVRTGGRSARRGQPPSGDGSSTSRAEVPQPAGSRRSTWSARSNATARCDTASTVSPAAARLSHSCSSVSTSSALDRSSSTTSSGSCTRARAVATRWR